MSDFDNALAALAEAQKAVEGLEQSLLDELVSAKDAYSQDPSEENLARKLDAMRNVAEYRKTKRANAAPVLGPDVIPGAGEE
jgi:hypothetical protein